MFQQPLGELISAPFMPRITLGQARYNVPMFRLIRSLRVALIGLIVAGLGTTLYLLLFNVIDLKPSPAMLNAYVALSIAMSLGGLVTALVGAVTWARRAPRRHVLLAVAAISLVGVLLVIFGNVKYPRGNRHSYVCHNGRCGGGWSATPHHVRRTPVSVSLTGAHLPFTTPVSECNRDVSPIGRPSYLSVRNCPTEAGSLPIGRPQ